MDSTLTRALGLGLLALALIAALPHLPEIAATVGPWLARGIITLGGLMGFGGIWVLAMLAIEMRRRVPEILPEPQRFNTVPGGIIMHPRLPLLRRRNPDLRERCAVRPGVS